MGGGGGMSGASSAPPPMLPPPASAPTMAAKPAPKLTNQSQNMLGSTAAAAGDVTSGGVQGGKSTLGGVT